MEIEKLLNHYCLFYKDEKLTPGWIKDIQKNKFIVSPLKGRAHVVAPNRIEVSWKGPLPDSQEKVAHEKLRVQIEQIEAIAHKQEVEIIYDLCEPGKKYTLDELVADFIDTPNDPLMKIGLYTALVRDNFFFKRKHNTFIARSEFEIQQIKNLEQRNFERLELEKKSQQWVVDIESGIWNKTSQINDEQQNWIEQLKSVLIYGKNSSSWKSLSQVFNLVSPHKEEQDSKLRKLLSQVGHPISWGRLALHRSSVQFGYPQKSLDEADSIVNEDHNNEERKKWLDLPTFSIDSKDTKDFDDAFSIINQTEDHIKIAIHIADLSNTITPEKHLFKDVEKRFSSVYTLKEIFPMFPESLANEYFSLRENEDHLVMSFIFNLFNNGESKLQEIVQSTINIEKNLTYKEADLRIQQNDTFWGMLYTSCQAIRQKRVDNGALDIARKEIEIDIENPDSIKINPINRDTPANRIVEELAVLTNQEVGRFFNDNSLPGIYRTQAPYEIINDFKNEEKVKLEHLIIEPTRLSTVPDRHSGLGCDYYIQCTSPIRRFTDLVIQQQLSSFLKNKTIAFDNEQLMIWAEQSQIAQKEYANVERLLQKYWKAKYLFQQKGSIFEVVIKRHLSGGKTEVFFENIQYLGRTSNLSQFSLGEVLLLRIENIDIYQHFLTISIFSEDNPE